MTLSTQLRDSAATRRPAFTNRCSGRSFSGWGRRGAYIILAWGSSLSLLRGARSASSASRGIIFPYYYNSKYQLTVRRATCFTAASACAPGIDYGDSSHFNITTGITAIATQGPAWKRLWKDGAMAALSYMTGTHKLKAGFTFQSVGSEAARNSVSAVSRGTTSAVPDLLEGILASVTSVTSWSPITMARLATAPLRLSRVQPFVFIGIKSRSSASGPRRTPAAASIQEFDTLFDSMTWILDSCGRNSPFFSLTQVDCLGRPFYRHNLEF